MSMKPTPFIPFGNVVVHLTQAGTVANSAKHHCSLLLPLLQGVNVLTYVDETALDANSRPGVKRSSRF
jgi:hypothetical protein